VNEKTGTLIMQTYGQATHLGYLQVTLDNKSGEITHYEGKLIPVDPYRWGPDPKVAAKLRQYRSAFPELAEKIGVSEARMNRRYIEESDVGNLFADAFVEATGADIGFVHSGSLRKDLPGGDVRLVDILDTYPFVDDVIVKEMTGEQIRRALEQSLTMERGFLQVSGLSLSYDLRRPVQQRIVTLEKNGTPIRNGDRFIVAAPGFLAEGGDLYVSFREADVLRNTDKVSDIMIEYFSKRDIVAVPDRGRQTDVMREQ
jgi:2',3'-cyclic-nucleotide 2'-phosphodiesterase/3'-nucleotidase